MSVGINDPLRSQNTYKASPWGLGVYGQSVVDHGLCVNNQVSGFGLVTRGLVWPFGEIWLDQASIDGLVTTWSDVAPVTTSWIVPAADAALDYAGGLVGFYRATKAFGAYDVPNSAIIERADGFQYTRTFASFTNSNRATWAVPATINVNVGDVYADPAGGHFTITSTASLPSQTLETDGASAPYGIGMVASQVGGVLTKVSGAGDATISYESVADTDYYVTTDVLAVFPGVGGNTSAANQVVSIVTALADTSIVILDSAAMSFGKGIYTAWTPSREFGQEFIV